MSDNDRVFEVATFLVTASGSAMVEAPRFAAQRMLWATGRLIETFEVDDPFLQALRDEIDANLPKARLDPAGGAEWIDELMRRVAVEAASRLRGSRPEATGGSEVATTD